VSGLYRRGFSDAPGIVSPYLCVRQSIAVDGQRAGRPPDKSGSMAAIEENSREKAIFRVDIFQVFF
jgi:hypothetical protein